MDYRLGVDLGTTYTAAAILRDREPEMVSLGDHELFAPSVIVVNPDGTILVGDPAEQRAATSSDRTIREFKARLGDTTPVLLGGVPYTAESLMAQLLRWVLDQVLEREGGPPAVVAVTYPAGWAQHRRDRLIQVIAEAGVQRSVLITEPEAAAVRYASTERVRDGDVIGVYDLGGGTFDAAVLRRGPEAFELLGRPDGLANYGGATIDGWVFEHVRASVGEAAFEELDPADDGVAMLVHRLRRECVLAKEALSRETETTIPVVLPTTNTVVRLTRAELEEAIRPDIEQTIAAFRRTLSSAGLEPADLSAVLVAGGSSRIPLVRELLTTDLGRPVSGDAHPKHVVALGAAMRAAPTPREAPSAAGAPNSQEEPPGIWPGPHQSAARGDQPGPDLVPRPKPAPPARVTVESVRDVRPRAGQPATRPPSRSARRAAGPRPGRGAPAPALAAGGLALVTVLLALLGFGGASTGDVRVANEGLEGEETVRLSESLVAKEVTGEPLVRSRLTPSLAGIDLPAENVTRDVPFSLRGLRHVLAGPFEAEVRPVAGPGARPGSRTAVVRPEGSLASGGLLSIPGVVGIALLMFAFAYAESFLRPLRRNRPTGPVPGNTLLGMGTVGFAAGTGLALSGWVLGGHLLSLTLFLLCGVLGLAAGLAATIALTRRSP
jgi:molecular chaperone DnaK